MTGDERQDLKDQIMQAELANKTADTALRDEQRRWEPWKALSAAFAAGLAVASGLIAAITWIVVHIVR